MKKTYILLSIVFLLAGAAATESFANPKPGKHKSHKKAKKKKSKYMYNFQS